MNQQEELEALRASESIKHANLQELARLVLDYQSTKDLYELLGDSQLGFDTELAENAMIDFAKGAAQ